MAKKIFLLFLLFPFFAAAQQKDFSDVKIAGHRGGYYYEYPESSLSLFQYISGSFQKDTIIVEIDLRKSKSGTLFIMHDETVDRTTNGMGKISELEDQYIRSLLLKKENGEQTKERIPSFEDVLWFVKKRNINLMLDIKIPIHAEAYRLIKRHKLENRILTLTFNMDLTRSVAQLSDQVNLSALVESEKNHEEFMQIELPAPKKIAYINHKTPLALIEEMRKQKVRIMADVSEALRHNGKPLSQTDYRNKVTEQKLDILITDFPVEAMRALKN